MKNKLLALLGLPLLFMPPAATAQQFGVFYYHSDGSAITITGYIGGGGPVTIPPTIAGLPVTSIGDYAFQNNTSLITVSIPTSVTNIGTAAFAACTGLARVTILSAVTSIGLYAFDGCTSLTSVTILGSVTSIRFYAFHQCAYLTSVTILNGVTYNIDEDAFQDCYNLQGVFFNGNAPSAGSDVFSGDNSAIVYYLPGTTGWSATFGGVPARLWNPLMQASGIGPAGFGFNITGTADIPIVIEAAASPANASWLPLQSLNLTNGAFYFTDPNWTNYPARFYRIRWP